MANINIYRGFSNVQEVIQVLINETAGGELFMSDIEWDNLYGQEKDEVISRQIRGEGGAEGAVRVTYRNKRDRKGVIEYTLDSGVAQGYGTLCVIGATVDDSAILVQTQNREKSVVFRTCEPIFIHSFALGWFYNGYSKPIPEELKGFIPYTQMQPSMDPHTQSYLELFIQMINLEASSLRNMIQRLSPLM